MFLGSELELIASEHPAAETPLSARFSLARRQQFEATFGSQVSWRWLLPLPGGEGDPCDLRVSSKACDLW